MTSMHRFFSLLEHCVLAQQQQPARGGEVLLLSTSQLFLLQQTNKSLMESRKCYKSLLDFTKNYSQEHSLA